jgi:cation diffusion facilitator family transporter
VTTISQSFSSKPSLSRREQVRRVLVLTLILNVVVALGKIIVGLMSGALAVLADGFHSLSDAAGNIAALIANHMAARPPDENHPYGHRRFETVGALVIGALLLFTAWEVFQGVIGRLFTDISPVSVTPLTVGVLVTTLVVNLGVSWYQRREGRRLSSELLLADAENTRADVFVTLSVLASSLLVWAGFAWMDTITAAVVAALICRAALRVLWGAGGVLVDTAPFEPDVLHGCVACVPQVDDVLRVRSRGTVDAAHIDVDVAVQPSLTTAQTTAIAAHIRQQVIEQVQGYGGDVFEVEVHFAPSSR